MSHQVLARKWRPREFASLAGQEHVVRALTHALQTGRIHHAYLFTGTRGVGKTSIARILAKALNCEVGVGPTPCGRCSACVGIDSGRFPDYIEMDAASNRGVDEMAQLLDAAVYAPVAGRTKVYVIDEVHMLSTHAFNAMLKTLEEPPAHVVFVLATTDAQKVPITVLSRCLQFSLKNMPPATIAARLREVLEAEQIAFESEALDEIGRAAAGSMRDALSLLDQAIAHGGGSVESASVREMVGVADRGEVGALINALLAGEGPALMARADAMVDQGVAPERTLEALAALVHRIALAQVGAVSIDDAMSAQVSAWAAQIAPEDLQVWWQIAIQGGRDLPWAPDPASGLTMTLLRMLAFRPGHPSAGRLSPPAAKPALALTPALTPAPASRAITPLTPAAVEVPVAVLAPVSAPVPVPVEEIAVEPSPHFGGDWPALARVLNLSGIARQCVDRSALVSFDHDEFVLRAPIRAMTEAALVAKIRDALTSHFGRPMRVSILSGDVEGPTVAGIDSAEQAQRLAQAQAVIQADPFVQGLIQDFGAQIVPGSVQPTL
jgi:DNA polymerase-3 subunit gamma/tau